MQSPDSVAVKCVLLLTQGVAGQQSIIDQTKQICCMYCLDDKKKQCNCFGHMTHK